LKQKLLIIGAAIFGLAAIAVIGIGLTHIKGNGISVYTIPQKDIDTAVSQVADIQNWCIGNALVTVSDYQPGDTINEMIVVHNGSDQVNTFSVASQSVYAALIDWTVTTTTTTTQAEEPNTVTLQPMESKVVYITFKIPKDTAFNPAYNFMVNVNKVSQNSDFIQTAYQQKWKVY
jgi:hypothetical protein